MAIVWRNPTPALLAVCALVLALAAPADANPRLGVVPQDTLEAGDFERMERGGIDTLRFNVRWDLIETAPGAYNWASADTVFEDLPGRGISPLPVLFGTPSWLAGTNRRPPLRTAEARAAWKRFLEGFMSRYGRVGSFWGGDQAGDAAVRRVQVWNEPNFNRYWSDPSPRDYARLLELSIAGLRGNGRRPEIVLGGLAPVSEGIPWWRYLRRLLAVRGAKRAIDTVALHPYSRRIGELRGQLDLARRIMRARGAGGKPIAVTEIGWGSGRSDSPFDVGPGGQARMLTRSFRLLSRTRRWDVSDVLWYAWQDTRRVEEFCIFCRTAGLLNEGGKPKPSWDAFRRAAK